MKALLKKLATGRNTSALLLAGCLMLLLLFREKRITSRTMEYDLLIQKILTGNGYSPRMARMIAAVSRHETGNYSSAVFREFNNMFGMRFPRVRKTTATHESDSKYSVYSSPADSVRDLVYYLDARRYPFDFATARDLVEEMKRHGYFEDDLENYVRGVERALPKVASA